MQTLRVALLGVTSAAVIAGCGATSKVDRGGFTAQDRSQAMAALGILSQTAVWTTAAEVTYTNGNVAKTCSLHIANDKPLTFELFLTWFPGGAGKNRRYAWLQAVIGPQGLKADYSFHLGYEPTAKALASHYGNAYTKPAERCLVEQNGTFALLPSP